MITIAIDGPSGAGKSTIADVVAQRLNFYHLNTGELYRAIAYKCVKNGVDYKDEEAVIKANEDSVVDIKFENGSQKTYIDGEMVSDKLHTAEMGVASSFVAKYLYIRTKVRDIQRKIASEHNIIIEGRDIGSEILPNATHKIYLTASVEERARRRVEQLAEHGEIVSYEETLEALKVRDDNDMNRKISPLVIADGAVVVDSTNITFEQTVEQIVSICKGE